jgi:glycosyltransferase involved in cell wall biosynthesis
VLYFNGPPPDDPLLRERGVVVRALGGPPTRGLVWQEIRLPAAAVQDGLDVFFSPAYSCPLRLDLPRVTTVHDLSFFSLPHDFTLLDGARRRWLVSAAVRASRRVVAVSDFTKREIAAHLPEAAGKVVVIPHGLDDDLAAAPDRQQARARLGVHGPMLLSVGSLLNRRLVPLLLRSLRPLRRTRPDLTLHVVGENRTHPPLELHPMLRSLGLEASVRLEGFVSEAALADRYAAADVLICLSEYEGFGLPVLEAMARRVPTIVARRPALAELFSEAALVVEPEEHAVAAAVERLLSSPSLRAKMVDRGLALAARHSWQTAADLTRETLHRAAHGS